MHSQVSAERQKRAFILESEGSRQSAINVAEGQKQAQILASEGQRMEKINQAVGEAEAIIAKANATATSIESISQAMARNGQDAVSLMVAEKYIEAFSQLAQKSTTLMLPANAAEPSALVAQAMTIFKNVSSSQQPKKE
ncbi:Cofactor-APC complex of cell division cycle 20-like protein 1 [Paramicrosporidium saccamoebae]|uniref:Cofactor-APC complex of cell division cycle 20-like protein 1 n=1 Tax=Paramicrosporidium saccamoebae TaxID=1246581 RepID=A0A2H9TLA6_9FUNG|nr:Cofactor-APC complex of cell division cycle 20-like protein 1 [Paramicrosporidium saccamoebae]